MSVGLKQCAVSAIAVVVLFLGGCSDSTTPPVSNQPEVAKKAAGPAEPVTAKTAFWPMYTEARHWAPDLVTLRLEAKEVPGFKNEGGKAAMWLATFGSPSQRQFVVYSYAIAAAPGIAKGVLAGQREPWNGTTRDVMPIDTSSFNIDSDAAYSAATTDAAAWLAKNPDKKLSSFQLGDTFRFTDPVWYLTWGDTKSGYGAVVNANTGKVLKSK
jgi:hypothetical protein